MHTLDALPQYKIIILMCEFCICGVGTMIGPFSPYASVILMLAIFIIMFAWTFKLQPCVGSGRYINHLRSAIYAASCTIAGLTLATLIIDDETQHYTFFAMMGGTPLVFFVAYHLSKWYLRRVEEASFQTVTKVLAVIHTEGQEWTEKEIADQKKALGGVLKLSLAAQNHKRIVNDILPSLLSLLIPEVFAPKELRLDAINIISNLCSTQATREIILEEEGADLITRLFNFLFVPLTGHDQKGIYAVNPFDFLNSELNPVMRMSISRKSTCEGPPSASPLKSDGSMAGDMSARGPVKGVPALSMHLSSAEDRPRAFSMEVLTALTDRKTPTPTQSPLPDIHGASDGAIISPLPIIKQDIASSPLLQPSLTPSAEVKTNSKKPFGLSVNTNFSFAEEDSALLSTLPGSATHGNPPVSLPGSAVEPFGANLTSMPSTTRELTGDGATPLASACQPTSNGTPPLSSARKPYSAAFAMSFSRTRSGDVPLEAEEEQAILQTLVNLYTDFASKDIVDTHYEALSYCAVHCDAVCRLVYMASRDDDATRQLSMELLHTLFGGGLIEVKSSFQEVLAMGYLVSVLRSPDYEVRTSLLLLLGHMARSSPVSTIPGMCVCVCMCMHICVL
jgi:putative flippase GtrA